VEIDGQLGLCAAHRLQNRNKFFLHRDTLRSYERPGSPETLDDAFGFRPTFL
jgi:hypothetical protein